METTAHSPWDTDYKGTEPAPVYEPLWHMLQQCLRGFPVASVLDFGCGDGNYAYLMAEEGLRVTGVDSSLRAIEKAVAHGSGKARRPCEFIRQDSIPEDLPDNSFDVVVMLNVLHCLTLKERVDLLVKAKKVLKQGGVLFASVLDEEDESYPRHEWKEIEPNTFDDGTGRLFHFYSRDELAEAFKGFSITECNMLRNIHPEVGRQSALFVLTATNNG
ncbi:class I SAM-dependent methyltransferase [Desulfoluna spongiiphila]|uniref:Methyltransferase domain-containing protein n=1 Tax=Desulfoluna spongiiphila TaxID=419481 RepID=A0A1G5BKJ6_9BACT|nr:class I SAM-dependent methyltransferase [Desulfoluna spongiiphila]SCX90626.1 Methyltransferase domain-containing protein [Desulfoluna spongiiphila]